MENRISSKDQYIPGRIIEMLNANMIKIENLLNIIEKSEIIYYANDEELDLFQMGYKKYERE